MLDLFRHIELFPDFNLGLLNGWVLLVIFIICFGITIGFFPRSVMKRLYSKTGWTATHIVANLLSKMCGFCCFGLYIVTPLKIGTPVFMIGLLSFLLGLCSLVIALFNFKQSSSDRPVMNGLYKISRNPQLVCLFLLHVGICLSIGSYGAIMLLFVAACLAHIGVLAEEDACKKAFGAVYSQYLKDVSRYII